MSVLLRSLRDRLCIVRRPTAVFAQAKAGSLVATANQIRVHVTNALLRCCHSYSWSDDTPSQRTCVCDGHVTQVKNVCNSPWPIGVTYQIVTFDDRAPCPNRPDTGKGTSRCCHICS